MSTASFAASVFAWGVVGAYFSFVLGWLQSKAIEPHEAARRPVATEGAVPDLCPATCRFAWSLAADARGLAAEMIDLAQRGWLVLRNGGGTIEVDRGPDAPAGGSADAMDIAGIHGRLVAAFAGPGAAGTQVPGRSTAPAQGLVLCGALAAAELGRAGRLNANLPLWRGGACLYLGFLAVVAVAFGPGGVGLWTALGCAGGLGSAVLLPSGDEPVLRPWRVLASTLGPPAAAVLLAMVLGAWLWALGGVLFMALGVFVYSMRRRLVAPHRDLAPATERVARFRYWLRHGGDAAATGTAGAASGADAFHRHLGHAVALDCVDEWAELHFGEGWPDAVLPHGLFAGPQAVTVGEACRQIDALVEALGRCDGRMAEA
ncbi:MAG: hypothetical protein H6842_06920 [Rhodospirillaceae bacterium]|nr:hypothetical protein [Rhodospirillaceae bacterium]